jgi:hypothetical protein
MCKVAVLNPVAQFCVGHKPKPITCTTHVCLSMHAAVDLVQAGCAPITPNSTGGALVEQSSFSLSAHIHKRFNKLGGWVGSSSNLSANSSSPPESLSSTLIPPADCNTSALNSLASTMMLQGRSESPNSSHAVGKGSHAVEGSLDSVTAYLSARGHHVHAPAGLNGKRVQGLAEMHDAPANVLRKPLKAIFVPPREVSVTCRESWVIQSSAAVVCLLPNWSALCVTVARGRLRDLLSRIRSSYSSAAGTAEPCKIGTDEPCNNGLGPKNLAHKSVVFCCACR